MSKTKKSEEDKPEKDSEIEKLEKLGVAFGALEKRASERFKNENDNKNADLIEKANKQKEKEKIQESQETEETLFDINKELSGALFIPIDLFLNESLENKGITPFTEQEFKTLLDLILKLLPGDVVEKLTEASRKAKKYDWFKNIQKIIALSKHLYKMVAIRYKQYKAWQKTQEGVKEEIQ